MAKRYNIAQFETRDMRRKRHIRTAMLAAGGFIGAVAIGGASLWVWPANESTTDITPQSLFGALQAADPAQPSMALCGSGQRYSCVVDGDTIWLHGAKIRIADIDTPEVGEPRCQAEYNLGMQATYRLRDLLNDGPWSVEPIGARDEDQYGRKLRVLTRNGQSIGDMLVAEGLARTWTGRREPWC